MKKFKLTAFFAIIFLLFLASISFSEEGKKEEYKIIYKVINNQDSPEAIKELSISEENIKVPDYIELGAINPSPSETSEVINLEPNFEKSYVINFKLKDEIPAESECIVKLKINHDDKQIIYPVEDKFILQDIEQPTNLNSIFFPRLVKADEPQSIYASTLAQDDWSGIDTSQEVTVSIENQNTATATIQSSSASNRECQVYGVLQSPTREGTYNVKVSSIKDKAGNITSSKKIGTLTVEAAPKDKPTNSDESYDVFDSTLTHNKAVAFGPTKVAVYNGGYSLEMADLLASFGEAADLLEPENFAPGLAAKYPVLVIPSAALAGQTNVTNLREKFSAYVAAGGALIVMTQPTDTCYELLPDQVESIGYFQDTACYMATAGIRQYCYALAGQTDATVDGTADGVLTAWPEETEIWLYRLKNNFPALLAYKHGQGRVVVSNYYSDYAHGHSQLHKDEKALLRDLLSWGRDFAALPELKPGGTLPVGVPVKYAADGAGRGDAAKVRLILRAPDRTEVAAVEVATDALAPGGGVELEYQFNDQNRNLSNQSLGIWWVNYELYDAAGELVQSETEGQRVALSEHFEETGQGNLAVTVNATITAALEGTKIPFKIIAGNEAGTGRKITYKVYAILGTSSGQVTKEAEVSAGEIAIAGKSNTEITVELEPFKAFIWDVGQSWAKNWWRFEFKDEKGEVVVNEQRGVSVYKPAVKTGYSLINPKNPDAIVFKANDRVILNMMIQNLAPVGLPIQWNLKVKSKYGSGQPIFESAGEDTIDPVLNRVIEFTVPANCRPDQYQVEMELLYKGQSVTVINGDSAVENPYFEKLQVTDITLASQGISFNLRNGQELPVDYTVISRVYDVNNNMILEDAHYGTISGKTTENKLIAIADDNVYAQADHIVCFLVDPLTNSELCFQSTISAENMGLTVLECRQDQLTKDAHFELEIENKGIPVKDKYLVVSVPGLKYTEKYLLPSLGQNEKTALSLEVPLPENIVAGIYPIEFLFSPLNHRDSLKFTQYPSVTLNGFEINNKGILCNLKNLSSLYTDYQLTYSLYAENRLVYSGAAVEGVINGWETQTLSLPFAQINPFIDYYVKVILKLPSSGLEKTFTQWVQPNLLQCAAAPANQTIQNCRLPVNISVVNNGPTITGLGVKMFIETINIAKEWELPALQNSGQYKIEETLSLPETTAPGTYTIKYFLFNTISGAEKLADTARITILPPELTVTLSAAGQLKPGDACAMTVANTGNAATGFSYEAAIYDSSCVAVKTYAGAGRLARNETVSPSLSLPGDLSSGAYTLKWTVTTTPVATTRQGYAHFTVSGAQLKLEVATDQPIYQTTQPVTGEAQISNTGAYPVDGSLELTITKTADGKSRIDGWPCWDGDNRRTGSTKFSGKIDSPGVLWSAYFGYPANPHLLIGDLDGDGANEFVYFSSDAVYIGAGATGALKHSLKFTVLFPEAAALTAALLADRDGDGVPELYLCLDGRYLAALDGTGGLLWRREFETTVLSGKYLTAADFDQDGDLELLLDQQTIDCRTGYTLRDDAKLGTVADLDGDGKSEIVTREEVRDADFKILATRAASYGGDRYPILADLDGDGCLEIILYDNTGIQVYDRQYRLSWSQSLAGLEKVVVGDVDGDGFSELVTARLAADSDWYLELDCLSYQGASLWRTREVWRDYEKVSNLRRALENLKEGQNYEICGLLLADLNGDGRLELALETAWANLAAYNAQTGARLWTVEDENEAGAKTVTYDSLSIIYHLYEFPILPPPAAGDLDGDRELELLALKRDGLLVCVDDLNATRKQTPVSVTALPRLETDYLRPEFDWDRAVAAANGALLLLGNQGISYYLPAENRTGLISLTRTIPKNLAPRLNGALVEVWDRTEKILLGTVDPATMTYAARGDRYAACPVRRPELVRDNKYYFVKNEVDPEGSYYAEFFEEDLTAGTTRSLGKVEQYGAEIQILKTLDDATLLVLDGDTQLATLAIDGLARTEKLTLPRNLRQFLRLDDATILLELEDYTFDSNPCYLYRYEPAANRLELLLDWDQLRNLSEYRDWQAVRYLKKDDHTLYLVFNGDWRDDWMAIQFASFGGSYDLTQFEDSYYLPYLAEYDLATGNLQTVAQLADYGRPTTAAKAGETFYFTLTSLLDGVYGFNRTDGTVAHYPLSDELAELVEESKTNGCYKMAAAADGRLYLLIGLSVDGYDNNLYEIWRLDPATGQWLRQTLNLNADGITAGNLVCGETVDSIFLLIDSKLYEYDFAANTLSLIDSGGYDWKLNTLYYDTASRRLYYRLGGVLKTFSREDGTIATVADLGERGVIGVKGDLVYLAHLPVQYVSDAANCGLWQYSLSDGRLTLLTAINEPELTTSYYFETPLLCKDLLFDPDELKVYAVSPWEILGFNLEETGAFISEKNIYAAAAGRLANVTVAQRTVPVTLAAGATAAKTAAFGALAEPGLYTLTGYLQNSLGQTLARDEKQFVVTDNGLGLTLAATKQYYRPGEILTVNGTLLNTAALALDGLKLTVTQSGGGQNQTILTTDLSLAAGENRPYTATATLPASVGQYLLEAKLTLEDETVATGQTLIEIAEPSVGLEVDAPAQVGGQPFAVRIKLTNTSPYPITVTLSSSQLNLTETLELAAGETVRRERETAVAQTTAIIVNVSGDAAASVAKTVTFAVSAALTVKSAATVPASLSALPYLLRNTGGVAATIPVRLQLYRDAALESATDFEVYLESGQSIDNYWPVSLTPGEYRLVYSVMGQSAVWPFTCLPDYAAEQTATYQLSALDALTLTVGLKNTGYNSIPGQVSVTSDFAQAAREVELAAGTSQELEINLSDLPLEAGTYNLTVAFQNNATGAVLATTALTYVRAEETQPAPVFAITALPENLTVGIGRENAMSVKISNTGDLSGTALVELVCDDYYAASETVTIAAGAEAKVTFKPYVPDDYESGTYTARVYLNGEATDFTYNVSGYKLAVTPSLDRPSYQQGETAVFTLDVQNRGGQANIPLLVRVKQGDFDETRTITLNSSATLTFAIPVTDFTEKIFYGFYLEETGRSLYLDVYNLYGAFSGLKVALDKERYTAGETVKVQVEAAEAGWLGIVGPGDFHRFETVSGVRNYNIALPAELRTGTYSVWIAFAGETREYKIDVTGYDVKFVAGELKRTAAAEGETFQLDLELTSGTELTPTAILELVKPDQTAVELQTKTISLQTGLNRLSFTGAFTSGQSGTHWLRLRLRAGDLTVAQNSYAFIYGDEELLSVTTGQTEYLAGTEPVTGEVHLYGAGNGTVTLKLDGTPVATLPAVLDGATTLAYSLGNREIAPGVHTVSAVYQSATAQTGTVSAEFNYGTGLPDLEITALEVGKEPDESGALPITVTVRKGNVLPAEKVNVQVKLGETLLGEYTVAALSAAGATHQQVIDWNYAGFSGAGAITATVNSDRSVREFDPTNNTLTTSVVIPMIPEITALPETTNNPALTVGGRATPDSLVYLYDDAGIIDFTTAAGSGSFSFTDFNLTEGENRLRLKAKSREGWESLFSGTVRVSLDSIAPEITIANVDDGQYLNYDLQPELTIIETNPAEIVRALDGLAWEPGTVVTAEGPHAIYVAVADIAGNRTELSLTFTIDKTAPEIAVAGIEDGMYYNREVTPEIQITDLNPETTELTLNGEDYDGGPVTAEGDYELTVTAIDKAGNTSESYLGFGIDLTPPQLNFTASTAPVTIGGKNYYRPGTKLTLTAEDPLSGVAGIYYTLDNASETLYQQPLELGTGTHAVNFYGVDLAGNRSAVQTVNVTILWIPEYGLVCRDLKALGSVTVAGGVFANRSAYLLGVCEIDRLGTTAATIRKNGRITIREERRNQPAIVIPAVNWGGLAAATRVKTGKLKTSGSLENAWVKSGLLLAGNVVVRGILVVEGDLVISSSKNFDDVAIFCKGTVTVAGGKTVKGLIYAAQGINVISSPRINGLVLTKEAAVLAGGRLIENFTDVYKYLGWFN